MSDPFLTCNDDRRRDLIRESDCLNGIAFLEYEPEPEGASTTLIVRAHLVRPLSQGGRDPFDLENITFTPGVLKAVYVKFDHTPDLEGDCAVIRATVPNISIAQGERFTLSLVPTDDSPLTLIDPRYRSATFRILPKIAADDCFTVAPYSPAIPTPSLEIDYLAKDYASFRQLLLDRLASTLPEWRDRESPDLMLTLVEILAYAADHLSYAQDAVSTEAYLDTARLRTSVRRHARLVDYQMHEGCNARAWLALTVSGDPVIPASAMSFLTRPEGMSEIPRVLPAALAQAPRASYEVFEPLSEAGPNPWFHPGDLCGNLADLLARLKSRDTPAIACLCNHLTAICPDAFDRDPAVPEEHAQLLVALTEACNLALSDHRLDPAGVTRLLGTQNAHHGHRRCCHNRKVIEQSLPDLVRRVCDLELHAAHNRIEFHTWGNEECCLARGATHATLRDDWKRYPGSPHVPLKLSKGDFLLLEEIVSPRTGHEADADPAHRHIVRLTGVEPGTDCLTDTPIVEVTWDAADALPFPLSISAISPAPDCVLLKNISVARGNVILVDHGETIRTVDEATDPSAAPIAFRGDCGPLVALPFPGNVVPTGSTELCCMGEARPTDLSGPMPRFEPVLPDAPLVFRETMPTQEADGPLPPARDMTAQDPHRALPQVALFSPLENPRPWLDTIVGTRQIGKTSVEFIYERWQPRFDLLASDADDRHFVVEVDDAGIAHLRFGDGISGARPAADIAFLANYRVGGGTAGNVGQETIRSFVLRKEAKGGSINAVRNPQAATGGIDPEPVAMARLFAPHAFRDRLARAITPSDYETIVLRDFADQVQSTRATTDDNDHSKLTILIDPFASQMATAADLAAKIEKHLERYRSIGHHVTVKTATTVPVFLTIEITASAAYRVEDVRTAVRERFSNRVLADGTLGFFHPDAVRLGQEIAISQILAIAWSVPGVKSAKVTNLSKTPKDTNSVPSGGVLSLDDGKMQMPIIGRASVDEATLQGDV